MMSYFDFYSNILEAFNLIFSRNLERNINIQYKQNYAEEVIVDLYLLQGQ